jgi:hypothetical protein
MSRLTGTDAYGLMEAYNNVYAPQELTEEQVWEEVETWVNSLLEEGYDLSDYTWEEMYEGYLEEILGMPSAQNAGAALRQSFGQARRAVGGAIGDVAGSAARGVVGKTTTSRNPISQAYNAVTRGVTAVPRAAYSFAGGVLSGKPATTQSAKPPSRTFQSDSGGSTGFGRYGAPPSQVKTPKPAPARDIPASPKVAPAPAPRQQPAPAPRPSAAPARTATPPGGTTKPAATATPTPAPSASPARPSLSSQADEIRQMRARSLQRQGKTLDAATVSGATRPAYQANSFDVFDVIKGHLIDEGYADTEEAALVIMANMSEEWKQSIVEDFPNVLNFPSQGGSRSGDAGTRGLKMIQTPGGQRGYINKHSGGEILPSGTVNKIMGGNLMVKNGTKKNTNSNIA